MTHTPAMTDSETGTVYTRSAANQITVTPVQGKPVTHTYLSDDYALCVWNSVGYQLSSRNS